MDEDPAAEPPAWHERTLVRHVAVGLVSLLLVLVFKSGVLGGFGGGFGRGGWNRPVAQAAVVVLCVTLTMGPLARLWPRVARTISWRRELGAWSGILSLGHVLLALDEWAAWHLSALWLRFQGEGLSLDPGLALANLAGVLAAGYALLLLATSNDAAQRLLGPRWGRLQAGATTFLLLVVLHTAFFLYLDRFGANSAAGGLHLGGWTRSFRWIFLLLVAWVVAVRSIAFWWPRSTGRG